MSAPAVPQRPVRSQNTSTAQSNAALDVPQVPSRPARSSERSTSPGRSVITRSPLNDSPYASNVPSGSGLTYPEGYPLEKRPSVQALPLIGQEGMEYASLEDETLTASTKAAANPPESPNETRRVPEHLPMHAPTASASPSTSRSQVAPVTRLDSVGAAQAGIGKPSTEYDETQLPSRVREFRPSDSGSSPDLSRSQSRDLGRSVSRPESMYGDEHDHGIPHLGLYAPLLPNAGDVQAPSPGPTQSPVSTGVGYHNKVGHKDGRRKSWQGPPGSYGLHGHGMTPKDQFERSWYQKHPEELAKEEQGAYGPSMAAIRSQSAMNSEDLNRLVRDTATRQARGTAPPDEDFGYKISEEYSRQNSPQLKAVKSRTSSQSHQESPLRNASYAEDVYNAHAFDSENEDERLHLGPRKLSTPALAEDEVIKGSSSPRFVAVVTPSDEKTGDESYFATSKLTPVRSKGNRPGSAKYHHDVEGHGTHLDEIEEYEPLFNDEDEKKEAERHKIERLRRAELERRFPSRDIWEDTPTSLQLHTTVSAPQEPDESESSLSRNAPAFEPPDREQERRAAAGQTQSEEKPKFNPDVEEEIPSKPAYARRHFPSRDIWEDTPNSLQLVTTVDEEEEAREMANQADGSAGTSNSAGRAAPTVPSRPARSNATESGATVQPTVPPRPQRAKPQVPPRPAKAQQDGSSETSPLAKTVSAGSSGSTEATSPTDKSVTSPAVKPKPTVPSKPQAGSSKFASIKAGFMNDLNSRLQQGPQAKKSEAPSEAPAEEEKAPLADARKGRARGPVRRKPAEPSPSDRTATLNSSSSGWSIVQPTNMWSISNTDSDDIIMGTSKRSEPTTAGTTTTATETSQSSHDMVGKSKPRNIETIASQPISEDAHKAEVSPLATNAGGERLKEGFQASKSADHETPSTPPISKDEAEAPVSPLATNTAGEFLSKTTTEYPQEPDTHVQGSKTVQETIVSSTTNDEASEDS